jgi:hypothetical protein
MNTPKNQTGRALIGIASALALAAAVILWAPDLHRRAMASGGRTISASLSRYSNDPMFHDFEVCDAATSSLAEGDQSVEIKVLDPLGAVVMSNQAMLFKPVSAGASKPLTNRVRFRSDCWDPGDTFTAVATYYDADGNVTDTEATTVSRR